MYEKYIKIKQEENTIFEVAKVVYMFELKLKNWLLPLQGRMQSQNIATHIKKS
jgi:hypothetical protein